MAVSQEEKVCNSFFETLCIFSVWYYVALLFSCSLFNPRHVLTIQVKLDVKTK